MSSRSALEAAGVDARSTTLPGFLDALHDHLAREARPRASLESASSSAREKPLMYGAYKAAASPTSKAKGKERERERTERGGRGGTAEAVMTAGGLALLGVGEGYDEAGFSDVLMFPFLRRWTIWLTLVACRVSRTAPAHTFGARRASGRRTRKSSWKEARVRAGGPRLAQRMRLHRKTFSSKWRPRASTRSTTQPRNLESCCCGIPSSGCNSL